MLSNINILYLLHFSNFLTINKKDKKSTEKVVWTLNHFEFFQMQSHPTLFKCKKEFSIASGAFCMQDEIAQHV